MTRRMRRRVRADDAGFTLIELIMTMLIMGIITIPLANFVLSYFENYQTTENRLSDSHDIQIATAYFSQDVANADTVATTSAAGDCGFSATSPTVLLLKWTSWSVTTGAGGLPTGASTAMSVAYVKQAGTLHRVSCGGASAADIVVVHGLVSAVPSCLTATGVTTSCTPTTPPRVRLTLTIASGSTNDSAAPEQPVTLDGQRRQT